MLITGLIRIYSGFLLPPPRCVRARHQGAGKEVITMSRKTRGSGSPGWLKMVVCFTVAMGAAAGAGHVVGGPASQPTTACVELQALLAGRVS